LREDLNEGSPLNVEKAAMILRDRKGWGGSDIGMGNEKAMNQLIAHHSIIFKPEQLLVWISTGPWQLGRYKCFDLRKIFHNFAVSDQGVEIEDKAKEIPADSFLKSAEYNAFIKFRDMKGILHKAIKQGMMLPDESSFITAFINSNPRFYESWYLSAEYFHMLKRSAEARTYYYKALGCEVPRWQEKQTMIRRIVECDRELKRN
jgi:hypothetical protein